MKLKLFIFALSGMMAMGAFAQRKTPTKAEQDASKIIQLGNSVMKLSEYYSYALQVYDKSLEKAESSIDSYQNRKKYNIRGSEVVKCIPRFDNKDEQEAYKAALKAAPAFPEKSDIENNVANGEKYIVTLQKWCGTMNDYFTNEEFAKDSGFTNYKAIRDSLAYHLEGAYQSWQTATTLASEAGEKAEEKILGSSKIASFIIPMKKDLNSVQDAFAMFNTDGVDLEAIKSKLAELSASLEKNKDISTKDVSKLSDAYYKEVYQNFYKKCADSVNSMSTLIVRIEENSESHILESWYGGAVSSLKAAIQEYNSFIKQ